MKNLKPLCSSSQAKMVEENLIKTQDELHNVMSSSPAAAPDSSSSSSSSSDNEDEHENSTYSAELQTQGINDHREEEERLTEAEKNQRLQKKLKVSSRSRIRGDNKSSHGTRCWQYNLLMVNQNIPSYYTFASDLIWVMKFKNTIIITGNMYFYISSRWKIKKT